MSSKRQCCFIQQLQVKCNKDFPKLSRHGMSTRLSKTVLECSSELGVNGQGLLPVWIQRSSGRFTVNRILTVGAMADSYYEYLLKAWLFLHKQVRAPLLEWCSAAISMLTLAAPLLLATHSCRRQSAWHLCVLLTICHW